MIIRSKFKTMIIIIINIIFIHLLTNLQPVWHSGNGIRHINKVMLSRAWLVLGLVMTFGGPEWPG